LPSPFNPLTRHNEEVFMGLPDLTIAQTPPAHSVNPENQCVMERMGSRQLCPFHYPFEIFDLPY